MNKYRIEKPVQKVSSRTQVRISLIFIVITAVFFSFVAIPKLPADIPGAQFFNNFFIHLGLDLQGGTHLVYDADLSAIDNADKNSAIEGTRDVIERRVNTLGVAEPVVQTSKAGGVSRIIVELAGVQDVNEAITLIGETPLLEFREIGEQATSTKPTSDAISELEDKNRERSELAQEIIDKINSGEDFAVLASEFSDDQANKNSGGDLGWVGRGAFTQLFEETIFDEMEVGDLRSEPLLTEFGYHVIKKIDERFNDADEQEVHSAHILIALQQLQDDIDINWVNTALSGKNLKSAQVVFDPQTNQPQVNLTFDGEGSDLFHEITERNIGKQVGIFLDGSVISAPVVNDVISGGHAVISGNFDLAEAKLLSQRLNAGALPVPITLVNQQTIGASLGNDSLQKSLVAGMIGLVLVAIFMIAFYRLPGLLSVLALTLYVVIIFGLFQMIPVTLTLAGVAGFILSIGMAVDANILIFERVKEELQKGMSFDGAVEEGFKRAWLSIRDSNTSSLITCAILYWFGSSIIRGFAVTLGIGILVSLFSAITVTRTFLRASIRLQSLQKNWLFGLRKKNV